MRYDKCPQSLVGEAARTKGPCGAVVEIGGISSAAVVMGGLSNGADLISGVESAWRNLLSSWSFPTVDGALLTLEAALPSADEGRPTAEDGGDAALRFCGLLT